jgi:hypothetical protein
MKRMRPDRIVISVVVVVFLGFLFSQVVQDRPGTREQDGDVITETIGVVEPTTEAAFAIRLLEGSDAEHESTHVFEALAGLPGVGRASLDTSSLQLTVAYDDSLIDEAAIRSRLVDSGYIALTTEDATATEVSEDGTVQRIGITDTGDRFEPAFVLAQAGVPIEIEYGPGVECREIVKFPELGVSQDISEGGTVSLPALEPGEYQITCGGDAPEGVLIVE